MKNNIKLNKNCKKVLIVGANGFLGTNILKLLKNKENFDQNLFFLAADLSNTNLEKEVPFYHLDITNPRDIKKKILTISPDIIILTAAMTNVDQCEVDKKLATRINTMGPKYVLEAIKRLESKLIFMSTDFVFDGTKKNGFYLENDIPNPLSHYARTKYEAELSIINSEINYLICRTAVLYGWNDTKLNFITWILNKLKQGEKISIVTNQINSPTFVRNLAQTLLTLIEKDAKGIYHTAGDDVLSRYEMALLCAEIFNYKKELIVPIDSIKQKAIRPKNVSLDISKLKKLIGSELKIYNLDDGLNYMKAHIK